MKMFFGGSAAIAATLLASSVLFYASPLFAEPLASRPSTSTQQEKKENTEAAQPESVQAETRQSPEPTVNAAIAAATGGAPLGSISKTVAPSGNVSTEAVAAAASAITSPQAYIATAYSLPGKTASGMRVAKGVIAADPRVLPLGTRVRLEAGPYSGEYIVADTGSAVRGRKIDVWVPSMREACHFGRRNIKLSVLSYGGRRAKVRR